MNSRKAIKVVEITTNKLFDSMRKAEQYFNISNGKISQSFANKNVVKIKGYIFKIYEDENKEINKNEKHIFKEIVEVTTGKKFKTTSEASIFFEIPTETVRNSLNQNRAIKIRKGKYRCFSLKFEELNYSSLSNLLNKKIINVNTSEVMTVEAAAKKYNVAPYKINECISFGHAISYNNSKIYFKNLEINKEKIIFSEKDKIVHKDIKKNESFDILTNKSGQVIIIQDDKIVKRFETAEDLLNYFDKKEIEINLEEEKIICHI